MIGNDIVDLNFAHQNSRWQEQRFLDKLFSEVEQEFILSDINRFQNIWRLWSMKESAYKIISRSDGVVRFNPQAYQCLVKNETQGSVRFENFLLPTLTTTLPKFIQTTAFLNHQWTSEVFQLVSLDANSQRIETYQYAIKILSHLKGVSENTLAIIKNERGVPEFYCKGVLQSEHLSLSHHGAFAAIAVG